VEAHPGELIRATIEAGCEDADRIVAVAASEAGRQPAGDGERALATDLVERMHDLRRQIEGQQRRIQSGYAELLEAMAMSSIRLAEAARNADFSTPPRPSGLGHTIEVRLAQTREVTVRFESGSGAGHGPSYSV